MQSSDQSGAPAEWAKVSPRKFLPGFIFIVILGAAMVVAIPGFIAIDKPEAVKYCVSLAVLFFAGAAIGFCIRISSKTSLADLVVDHNAERPATRMRSSRTLFFWIFILTIAFLMIAISAAIDFYSNIGSGEIGPQVGFIVASLVAIVLFTFPLQVALRRIQPGHVSLSQDGIHHRAWTFDVFLPWSAFAGVKATYYATAEILAIAYQNTPWEPRRTGLLWAIDKPPTVPMIDVNCAYFKLDSLLMYQMMKFYVENPSMREELGTEASITRARSQNYGTEPLR